MISKCRRAALGATARLLAMLAAAAVPLATAGRAEAQYGFGYGYGFNLYNQNAYADANYLNQRSLVNAQIAGANRPQPLQAPSFQSRDEGFMDRYDLSTREAIMNRVARDPSREMGTIDPTGALSRNTAARPSPSPTGPRPLSQSPPPPPRPTSVNLAIYFNKDNQLVWPSMSPITGDFGKKQAAADQATLAVRNEYDTKGLAQLSTVTDARQKLLDYGRPALKLIKDKETPRVADSFHMFLLQLYDSLAQATNPS